MRIVAGLLAFALGATLAVSVLPPSPPEEAVPDGLSPDGAGAVALAAAREAGAQPPLWSVGEAWRVEFSSGFECWLVVASADAALYRQGASCDGAEHLVTEDAVFGYLWMGLLDADLGGVGQEDTVRWFDWPLEDERAWTTTYNGFALRMTAEAAKVEAPGGEPEAGFRIVARDEDGNKVIEYDYVPSLRWWSRVEFSGGFAMEVLSHRESHRGDVVSLRDLRQPLDLRDGGLGTPQGIFDASEEDDLVLLTVQNSGLYADEVVVLPPDGAADTSTLRTSFAGSGGFWVRYYEAMAGMWQVMLPGVHLGETHVRAYVAQLDVVEL